MGTEAQQPKRALILAGGGLKVAFQAGVLQVWLDEAGLTFDDADGASGGVFNLAMYCQGMTGREIADNWRLGDPKRGIAPNWRGLARGPLAPSLFTLDRYRRNVFPDWGLDWDRIRASRQPATFNAYNFSRNRLTVREVADLDEDFLVAAVSLPMWFPPVVIDGDTYIDAVFITDANLEEAIRRGADELWVIWTVSRQAVWRHGFLAQYFQVIETAANGHFRRMLDRIEASNARGEKGEFGRHIEVKLLQAEVPLHYLVTFSRDRVAEVVNMGVRAARRFCAENGIAVTPVDDGPEAGTRLSFTETMHGWFSFGVSDPRRGAVIGRTQGNRLAFRLTIDIDGLNRFLLDPCHEASVHGWVHCEALGGRLPVTSGGFNLFVQQEHPGHQRMYYRLHFADSAGNPLTLLGHKDVRDDAGLDLWSDTTTLFVRILPGHVAAERDGSDLDDRDPMGTAGPDGMVGAGVLRLTPLDLLRQLTTVRVQAATAGERVEAIGRFGQLFLGKLWDVYAQDVLSSSPI